MGFQAVRTTTFNLASPKTAAERRIKKEALQLRAEVDSARTAVENGPSDEVSLVKTEGNFTTYSGKLGGSSFNRAVHSGSQLTFSELGPEGQKVREVVSEKNLVKSTGVRAALHTASRLVGGSVGRVLGGTGLTVLGTAGMMNKSVGKAGMWLADKGRQASELGQNLEFAPGREVERLSVSEWGTSERASYEFHPNGTLVYTS